MSEFVGPALEVNRGLDIIIKGTQHDWIQEMDWLGCLMLINYIIHGSNHLTGGSVLTVQNCFVFWFEASYLQKVILIKWTNFLCNEMVPDEFGCLKFEFLRKTRMEKGQVVSYSLLYSLPLQQKWMQTLSGKSREKISLILILGCVTRTCPCPTECVSWCRWLLPVIVFFLHWTGDGFTSPSGVVVLHLSPAEVQSVGLHWWVGLVPKLLAWGRASGLELL